MKINFQPADAPVPVGYVPDTGEAFGDRGNGRFYGWNQPVYNTQEGDLFSNPLYNTFNQFPAGYSGVWEAALENGNYNVHVVCGSPSGINQYNTIEVEGITERDVEQSNFDEYDFSVTVSDGRLTIRDAMPAIYAKICFVDIIREGYSNAPPWVNAGDDQSIVWPGMKTVQLAADVYDDDPDGLEELTVKWSKVSGAGDVGFVDGDDVEDARARFEAPGTYILRLEATDEVDQKGSDTVTVHVEEAPLVGDLDGDDDVDLNDAGILVGMWLDGGEHPADLDGSERIELGDFAILAGNLGNRINPVKINEFMASNSYTPPTSNLDIYTQYDGSGAKVHPDWIELYNSDSAAIDLDGWYLTDDRGDLAKWRFPAGVTIEPEGYLIVFASDKEEADYPGNYPYVDYFGALHTNFDLDGGGEYLAIVRPGGVVVHEYNKYPNQRGLISYGIASDGKAGYLLNPTPGMRAGIWRGAANSGRYEDAVADTQFSRDRGFYYSAFEVAISCDTEGSVIRYTTDGSTPALSNGYTYAAPITINTTTCLRAAAFKQGWLETNVDTQTYVFPDHVVQQTGQGFPGGWGHAGPDYEMDPEVVGPYADTIKDDLLSIPSMSLVMDIDDWFNSSSTAYVGGIYKNASKENEDGFGWERQVSVEYMNPIDGEDFQLNAGVRIQGGSSTSGWKSDKLSMRLKFKGGYGPGNLNYPLFGEDAASSFNTLVLDARLNLAWNYGRNDTQRRMAQYTRDQFVADIQNGMGGFAPHGRHVHLYLNGLYWGLYNVHERPDESFAEAYFGGDAYDYDVLKHRSSIVVNGSNADYNEMFSLARGGLSDDARYQEMQEYLDVGNFIDYMIVNFYVGNTDWAGHNWYATRNRRDPASKWRYHSWDAEHVLKSAGENVTGRNNSGGPTELHQKLKGNAEYRLLFADRLHKHFFNDGILTVAGATALYQERLDEVDRAVVGESARWGDNREDQGGITYMRDPHWVAERDRLLGSYFPYRTANVLGQLDGSAGLYPDVAAPSFSRHGGQVPSGFELEVTSPSGAIYYTLDGSDPRQPGGAPAGTAYSGRITLSGSATVKARALSGGTWSALNEATFAVGSVWQNLRITEIMYHPKAPQGSQWNEEEYEYVELKNIGAGDINLAMVRFINGIDYTFPEYVLGSNEHVLVVKNRVVFLSGPGHQNLGGIVAGQYVGALDNDGDRIELVDALGQTIHNFKYRDGWYDITDGMGFSLTVKDASDDPAVWDLKAGWRPSASVEGSPGGDDSDEVPLPGDVVINEILAHSHLVDSGGDWIELHNTTDSPIPVGGWFLSDSSDDLGKYEIDAATVIPAGDYVVFYENQHFGNTEDVGCHAPFALSENGETLYLHSGRDGLLTGYSYEEDFGASERDASFGLYERSTGLPNFIAMESQTKGLPNSDPKVGPIVISEIMYHPIDGDAEYLELLNMSGGSVQLYDAAVDKAWRVEGLDDFDILDESQAVTIESNERILLVKDESAFMAEFGDRLEPGTRMIQWTTTLSNGSLSNGGETIRLVKPGDFDPADGQFYVLVDRVEYSDGSHPEDGFEDTWPISADGVDDNDDGKADKSLDRKIDSAYGNDVINWQASSATPGWD